MIVKIEESWQDLMKEEFEKEYFKELVEFVKNAYAQKPDSIFPKGREIFKAFDMCKVDDVKVVILGQDPYPTRGHANGLCFSINPDVRPLAKSLQNIFKEIQDDIGKIPPKNGDLTRWAKQGVLLLNSILTVEEGRPLSHKGKGWERFTDEVIRKISQRNKNVVFMLWGSKAIRKGELISHDGNLILTAVHPSPLSAYRGFFGCKHFSQANDYLKQKNKDIIDW